jgi:hypothetical protein
MAEDHPASAEIGVISLGSELDLAQQRFRHYAGPITFQKTTGPVPLQAVVTSQAFAS